MSESTAVDALARLAQPWHQAFHAAWEAAQAGSIPVGASITNAAGVIVAVGRSRAREVTGPPGQLSNSAVAHAEMNALVQLPLGVYGDHTIWVTLEPCLQCIGGILLSSVGAVAYAGADALWAGVERVPELNAFAARRWPPRSGPRNDEFGVLAELLAFSFHLERYRDGAFLSSQRAARPDIAALAEELKASGAYPALIRRSFDDAVIELWSRLAHCRRR